MTDMIPGHRLAPRISSAELDHQGLSKAVLVEAAIQRMMSTAYVAADENRASLSSPVPFSEHSAGDPLAF